MIPVDCTVMREIAPRFSGAKMAARQAEIIADDRTGARKSTLEAYGIDTRLRIAHFLGQTLPRVGGLPHDGGICQRL